MTRYAVFVDAGYAWVQFGHVLKAQITKREDIYIDIAKMRESLLKTASKIFPNKELLRVYWYDGLVASAGPSKFNQDLARQDDIKLRYGTVNSVGQQKGVDGLLIADMLSLAQNRSITDALLVSGDGDLAPGVAAGQAMGIRVHRLEVGSPDATSPILHCEVDANSVWSAEEIREFLSAKVEIPDPAIESIVPEWIDEFLETLSSEELSSIDPSGFVPSAIDKKLLDHVYQRLGRRLDAEEKLRARAILNKKIAETSTENMTQLAKDWLEELSEEDKQELALTVPRLSQSLDRSLLSFARNRLQRILSEEEKIALRTSVRENI